MAAKVPEATVSSANNLADAFQQILEDPNLCQGFINYLSEVVDSDEKIEKLAVRIGADPEELKTVLRRPA